MNPYHQIRERYVQNRAGSNDIVVFRPWSEDELAEAIRMRRAGLGSTAIAKKLKRSRNSVIGALWRAAEPRARNNQHDRPPRPIPMRFGKNVEVYRCPCCRKWHVGRGSKSRKHRFK